MKKTWIRSISIVLLFAIQICFLLAIFREHSNSYSLIIFLASAMLLVLYSYLKKDIHHPAQEYDSIKVALWVPVGAVSSYFIHNQLALGPVIGAALTGTLASFIPLLKPKSNYLNQLPAAIYCGAFIGMSNSNVANNFTFVGVASVFTAVLLVVSKSLLNGIGGKLGTLAFLGVCLTYLLLFILAK